MAEFSDYTRFASSYCPNLPVFVFSRAMLRASREYFKRTQAWQDSAGLTLVADQSLYLMPTPLEDAIIDTVQKVSIDGEPLVKAVGHIDSYTGSPMAYTLPTTENIQFSPVPSESKTALIEFSMIPNLEATYLPDEVMEQHFEGLLAGAIWHIKRMVGTDWYDPQSATIHYAEFEAHTDAMRVQQMTGNNNATLRVDVY